MPLLVLLLTLVTPAPAKQLPLTEMHQIERQKEEMKVLKARHGEDVDQRMREALHTL